jgi:hypothetical protein
MLAILVYFLLDLNFAMTCQCEQNGCWNSVGIVLHQDVHGGIN